MSSSTPSVFPSSQAKHCLTLLCLAVAGATFGCGSAEKFAASTASSAPASAVANGPQLGYAWDVKDETLRPILGVPGSSQVGESVVPAGTYLAGASSSGSGLALLVGADKQVYRLSLPSGTPTQINLTASGATSIRFSPSGNSALLFVPGSSSAAVLTHLATTPQVRQIAASSAILDGAASDTGSAVGLLQSSGGATVSVLGGSGSALATLSGAGGVSFVGTGEDLLVADAGSNRLTLIRTASTAPSQTLLSTANLLKSPLGVGAALSGRWAVVANSGEPSVVRVDLSGATAPQRILCPAQPAVVAQMAGNGVFRFTDLSDAPVWIADVSSASPTMLFIPPLPPTAAVTH